MTFLWASDTHPGFPNSVELHEKQFFLANLKVADVSYAVASFAAVLALAINAGILRAVHANTNFIHGYAVSMLFTAMLWAVFAIPWFLFEQRRPGRRLPPGTSYFTVIAKAAWEGARACYHLRQVLIYLIAYFFMADTLQTAFTVTSTLTYASIDYNTVQLNCITMLGQCSACAYATIPDFRLGFGGEGISISKVSCLRLLCSG